MSKQSTSKKKGKQTEGPEPGLRLVAKDRAPEAWPVVVDQVQVKRGLSGLDDALISIAGSIDDLETAAQRLLNETAHGTKARFLAGIIATEIVRLRQHRTDATCHARELTYGIERAESTGES